MEGPDTPGRAGTTKSLVFFFLALRDQTAAPGAAGPSIEQTHFFGGNPPGETILGDCRGESMDAQ